MRRLQIESALVFLAETHQPAKPPWKIKPALLCHDYLKYR